MSSDDKKSDSLAWRAAQYYASKTANGSRLSMSGKDGDDSEGERAHVRQRANWQSSGMALKGFMSSFGANMDLPFKSIILFVGCWIMLETGLPFLIVIGIVTAGSVWTIPSAIPLVFLTVYCTLLTSCANLVRSIVIELGRKRDNLVKALFRGYFWSLLAVGLIYIVHTHFSEHTVLCLWPVLYFIPIDAQFLGFGGTFPVPIFLGITGFYMNIIAAVIIFAVGITGSCIGGIEVLRYVLDTSREHGLFGAIIGILVLAVFPAMNIYFSSVFLSSILDLLGRIQI